MNSISHSDGTSFAVVGPRRIGKSSLLKHIKQEVEQKEGFKAIYLDSSPWRDDIRAWYSEILRELGIQEESRELDHFVGAIDAYCRGHRLKLVLLLDEVDNLLSADERHDHVFFSTLRALINQAGVRVLVAGYRTLFHQLFSYNSPLFNTLEPIVLSALDRKDAFSLVEEPLRHIFTIEHADIDHVLDKTACHPNYIQFFCSSLVKRAYDQGRRIIVRSDIVQVADSQELYDFMVDTYLRNLDEKAQTLVYLMAAYYDRGIGRIIVDRKAHDLARTSKYAGESGNMRSAQRSRHMIYIVCWNSME